MHEFPQRDLEYVTSVDEVLWGGLLLALTITIHAVAMLWTIRASNAMKDLTGQARLRHPLLSLAIVVLCAWMIVLANLSEVLLWAGFFTWKRAQPNIFSAFYNAMLNYTTLTAGYLPLRWRLLEGMLGMGGVLTFAWSTGILFALAKEFMDDALLANNERAEEVVAVLVRSPADAGATAPSGKSSDSAVT